MRGAIGIIIKIKIIRTIIIMDNNNNGNKTLLELLRAKKLRYPGSNTPCTVGAANY